MSFGLLTALRVRDIPLLLRRVATIYRGTAENPSNMALWDSRGDMQADVWSFTADELDALASRVEDKVRECEAPKRRRLLKD